MIDQDFIDEYTLLLAAQFWEKPNARAEIEAMLESWSEIVSFASDFGGAFDLDTAKGDRLDKIGSLVGIKRTAAGVGFDDETYRFFIRIKIANNVVNCVMVSDSSTSLQDVIQFAFGGNAYVIDRQDMSLELFGLPELDEGVLDDVVRLGLLPKPAGVRYDVIEVIQAGFLFGFSDSGDFIPDNVRGFAEIIPYQLGVGGGDTLAVTVNGDVFDFGVTDNEDPLYEDIEAGSFTEIFGG